jgi:hypothetical protein
MEPVLEARLCMLAVEPSIWTRQLTIYENIYHQRPPTNEGLLTSHIPTPHTTPPSVQSYQSLQMS